MKQSNRSQRATDIGYPSSGVYKLQQFEHQWDLEMKLAKNMVVAVIFALPLVASADEMQTITVGEDGLPIEIAIILYSRVDPGATEAHFFADNPELVGRTFLNPGEMFKGPIGDRMSTVEGANRSNGETHASYNTLPSGSSPWCAERDNTGCYKTVFQAAQPLTETTSYRSTSNFIEENGYSRENGPYIVEPNEIYFLRDES